MQQIKLFLTALMFYTRIPVPGKIDHSAEMLNASTIYFPVMGWIVGAFSGLVFWGAAQFLPVPVAAVLCIIASILMTGAFHEDGLADVCDGFGGGWTKERILEIMKDSRVGAFGVMGIALALLLKYSLLAGIPVASAFLTLLMAHTVSRWCATLVIALGEYARADESSKVKPIAKKMSGGQLAVATVFGLLPPALLPLDAHFTIGVWIAVAPMLLATWLLYRYFRKWIGGYTGDCLGTIQQVAELICYLSIMAIWKFS